MSKGDEKQPAEPSPPTRSRNDEAHREEEEDTRPRGDVDKLAQPSSVSDRFPTTSPKASPGAYVAPSRVQLVAEGVGRLAKAHVPVSVRVPSGAGPSIFASASPDVFSVVAAPNILPSTDEAAPHHDIVVGFAAHIAN